MTDMDELARANRQAELQEARRQYQEQLAAGATDKAPPHPFGWGLMVGLGFWLAFLIIMGAAYTVLRFLGQLDSWLGGK